MIFILSEDVNKSIYSELCKIGDVFLLGKNDSFLPFESKHADMQLFNIDNKSAYVSDSVSDDLIIFLQKHSVIPFKIKIEKPEYPDCVALNVLKTKDGIIANPKTAYKNILEKFHKITNVSQGYTRCSACYIDKMNLVITGDEVIEKACKKDGYNVYLADNSKVKLNGYKNGFIGGTMFYIDSVSTLFVNGNLKNLDSHLYDKLSKNINIVDTDDMIEDIGSCIVFN